MRKVLVTGGAGFVGRRLVRRLLENGDEVHCVDSLVDVGGGIAPEGGWMNFSPTDHEDFHFYSQDCRAFFAERKDTDFDACFHLAAVVGGRMVIENNPLAVAEDLSIDAAYWQWATETRPGKTVTFSSSAAYPVRYQRREGYELLREEMIDLDSCIDLPDLTYGWAKLTNEYLGRLAWQKYGLRSVAYRPFSGYGEDQDMTYPVPSICKRVLENRGADSITVWGTGEQMRDFIFIEDCIDGIFQTLDKVDDGTAVNLSTGIFTSFIEFASVAARRAGYNPAVVGTSDKPEGPFARAGDTSKQEKLGFRYTTNLTTGIEKVLEFIEFQS